MKEIWIWKNEEGDKLSAASVDLLIKLVGNYKKTKEEEFEPEIETSPLRQSEKESLLKKIIGLEKEYGEDVPTEKVFALAEEDGIEREKAEEIIEALYRDAFIYSVGEGLIRVVR